MSSHVVAIIADVHFHDSKGDFGGVGVTLDGARQVLRSWADTQSGSRAVNETAMALGMALDRIAEAGIRHVILAGDYSDDGQAENIRRLADLLHRYEASRGLRFYVIPGNHDVYGLHGKHVSTRFMISPDASALVTSDPAVAADELGTAVVTPAMRCAGLPEAVLPLARFGLFRQPEHLHWESPFGLSDAASARLYDATAADGSVTHRLMDTSYLAEPEPGLWILMLDANVFEPRPGRADALRKRAFIDASDAGWTAVLRAKPFLLPWIRDVVARAKAAQKTLVTVSHYPVLDPFRDDAGSEVALFGQTTIARRTPSRSVGEALADTGLRWHAGGHMHVNATTQIRTMAGRFSDVALPSLAAFPPAFAIVRATPDGAQSQRISLDGMQPDPALHDFYKAQGRLTPPMTYDAFLAAQYRSHILTRRLPREWPHDLLPLIRGVSCSDFLILLGHSNPVGFASDYGLTLAALDAYGASQMIADAYLIRTAAQLAVRFFDPVHVRICTALAREFADATIDPQTSHAAFLRRFLSVLDVSLTRMSEAEDVML